MNRDLAGLAWFGLLWSVCCIGFLQLAGMYPLRGRRRLPVTLTVLWAMLLAGTLAFALIELRWTTIVVVGGVLFLFLPALFRRYPNGGATGARIAPVLLRDGRGACALLR